LVQWRRACITSRRARPWRGRILEQKLLLFAAHLPEQDAGLLIVIVVDADGPPRRVASSDSGGSISAGSRSIHAPLLLGQ